MKEVKYNDVLIKIGQNARENSELCEIDKDNQNYVWLHLNKLASPHVIICQDQKDVDKQTLYYAANLCREHSKFKSMKTSVICTTLKNLTKTKKAGEVIIKSMSKTKLI